MPFTEFETAQIEPAMISFLAKRRPPPEIRPRLDIAFRIEDQSVIIHEIRPAWNDPSKTIEPLVAKATFVRNKNHWKIFWLRADLKWHSYPPCPTVANIEDFLALVDADDHGCFWG
ncbi:hypothetical protein BH09VER1_BH09VER1_19670 [soil metagenome]